MTERGADALRRNSTNLTIGPSSLSWEDGELVARFDEATFPRPGRVRGEVRLRPLGKTEVAFALDPEERHIWRPLAPRAEVEVRLEAPSLTWTGQGYFDSNYGVEPLEAAFEDWDWCRAHLGDEARLYYDVRRVGGACAHLAVRFDRDGSCHEIATAPSRLTPPTFWRMPRQVRADPSAPIQRLRTLEDTPFYSRSTFQTKIDGEVAEVVHESLSGRRLRAPLVKAMLPFRMPRWFRPWRFPSSQS